jgi:tetratricopeptide (TPR) repeat protein
LLLPALAIVALIAVAYTNSLWNLYAWDDGRNIVTNTRLDDWDHLERLFKPMWRPLKRLSFMWDHAQWGLNPFGYHLTNVLWHAAASLALLVLLTRLGASRRLALVATALFAVHPVQVEAVANISNRKEMMAAFFYLLAFLFYLPLRDRLGRLPLILLAFAAALLSKESSPLMLPVMLAVYELGYRRPAPNRSQKQRLLLGACLPTVAVVLAMLAVGHFYRFGEYFSTSWIRWITQTEVSSYPVLVGNSLWALVRDLGLLLWPSPLSIRHDFRFTTSVLAPRALLALLLVVAYVGLVLWLRRRAPLVSFGLAWTGINLLPLLNLVPLTWWFVSERFLYLPSAGLCLAAAHLFALPAPSRPSVPRRLWQAGPALLLALVLGAAATRTIQRNGDWYSSGTIIFADLRKAPDNPYLLHWVATMYQESGDLEKALAMGERALEARPRYHATQFLLGQLLLGQGRVDEAVRALERTIELNPYPERVWSVLGQAYMAQGRASEALEAVDRGLSHHPDSVTERYLKANILVKLGRLEQAEKILNWILTEDPDHGFALAEKAYILSQRGRDRQALELYRRALKQQPNDLAAALDAARLSAEAGDFAAARRFARQVLEKGKNPAMVKPAQELLDSLPR